MYCNIIVNNIMESASLMGLDHFVFQHDNDPKHSSKIVNPFTPKGVYIRPPQVNNHIRRAYIYALQKLTTIYEERIHFGKKKLATPKKFTKLVYLSPYAI
jgi:hydroxymethylpyrimidine/phosphomethylpyrimidine kinase